MSKFFPLYISAIFLGAAFYRLFKDCHYGCASLLVIVLALDIVKMWRE